MTDDLGNVGLVDLAIQHPGAFLESEFLYISRFVNTEQEAVSWVASVGLYADRMEEHIESDRGWAAFARYIPNKTKKKKIRERIVENDRTAVIWGTLVPEDSDKVIDKVQGSEWAYKWAKHVGNAEEMMERVNSEFWKRKIKEEVMEDGQNDVDFRVGFHRSYT